jgi:hypothetical protein
MSTTTAGALAAAQKFLDLSRSEETAGLIVATPDIMSGMVQYLQHADGAVVERAAEACKVLAKVRAHRRALYEQPDLVPALTRLTGSGNPAVKKYAVSAIKSLNKYAAENAEDVGVGVLVERERQSSGQSSSSGQAGHNKAEKKKKHKEKKKKKRKTRTFALQVTPSFEHDDALERRIETQVIRVRGIISLTLDARRGQILVMTKKKSKEVLPLVHDAVRAAGARSELLGQVGKKPVADPAGGPSAADYGEGGEVGVDENGASGYLDDEEYFGGDRNGILSRFGSQSLQQRLAEQRRQEQARSKQQSTADAVAAGVGNAVRSVSSWFGY